MTLFVRKIFDWVVGLTLIAVGMLLGFVPMMPGVVLVIAGLAILSSHNRHARAIHERLKAQGLRMGRWIKRKVPGDDPEN